MSSYAYANSHAMKISTYFHLFTPDVDRVALVRQMPFRNYNVQLHFDGEILPAKIYYDKEKSCPEGVPFAAGMGTVPSTCSYGYESIPINTIFSGMNIHLPAILMFTRGTRF
jgi:hypothetical protein